MRSSRLRQVAAQAAVAMLGAAACGAAQAEDISAAVDRVFAQVVGPGEPGCAVGLMREGEMQHSSAYGLADIEAATPLSVRSAFNIASISKQFTAFSVLLLDARKALSIDDPLTRHVPELSASAHDVTLRDLIHHVGGLRDYETLLLLRGRRYHDGATQYESIQTLARQRGANFAPGARWDYSNTGYVLLGTVAERVSGRSLEQFMEENIFTPLGMRHTTLVDRYPAGVPQLARGYTRAAEDSGREGFEIDESAWEQIGDGQVHTTVADLMLWLDNLHTGKVGGAALMKRMVSVGALANGERHDYAAGLAVQQYKGLEVVRHGGGWAGYLSHFLLFPRQRAAVDVFCNRNDVDPGELAQQVADIYLSDEIARAGVAGATPYRAAEERKEPVTRWKPASLAAFEGAYWSEEAEARCVLLRRENQLFIEGCMPGYALVPGEEGELRVPQMRARLRFAPSAGKPSGFTLHTPGLEGLHFVRR